MRLIIRKVDNDPEWVVRREFSGPSYNIFLSFPVEILLAKRKWIKRMEELCDVIDANFNRPSAYTAISLSNPTSVYRRSLKRHICHRQCENRMGSSGFDNMLLVAPPRMNSRKRECP